MSRELILVTKRKYEDLLKRVEECNDRKHRDEAITKEEMVENANGVPTLNRSVIEPEHQVNYSTNNQMIETGTQTIVDDQVGAGSQPFVQMSFDTFDRIHSKKPRTNKKRKWVSFNL